MRRTWPIAAALALLGNANVAQAQPRRWHGAAALAADITATPEPAGFGIAIADLRGRGVVAGGDFHAQFNTDTLHVGVESIPLGTPRLQFGAALRGEALIAGLLRNYQQRGAAVPARGFFASYVMAFATLKWLPADHHAVELLVGARAWFFGRSEGDTSPGLALPPDLLVFEPRLRYTFWRITSPGDEWSAQVLFPRITGVAAGVELGLDVRNDRRPWGALNSVDDGRNQPGAPVLMARQWLRAGFTLGAQVRVQIEQSASWGAGEDDLTRVRIGGMSPYVVPVPGLAWPALLCERYVAAQGAVHVRPSRAHTHEVGVAVAGGVFNDVRRSGALSDFDGAGGAAVFGDLRFGRWQVYLRAGYAFPVAWLGDAVRVSAFVGVGARFG